MKRTSLTGAVIATIALAGAFSVTGPPAAATSEPTCHGSTPTIVAPDPTTPVVGTTGDDVIVSQGGDVQALAGNDVICVSWSVPGISLYPGIDAGPGDDLVDTTVADSRFGRSYTWLGAGADTYVGGDGYDLVAGSDQALGREGGDLPPTQAADTETDVISTGGGFDVVVSGSRTVPNHDRIDFGPGDYQAVVTPTAADGSLTMGAGAVGFLRLDLSSTVAGQWVVDTRTRTVTGAGASMSWTGDLRGMRVATDAATPPSRVTITGSAADDNWELEGSTLQADVRTAGGDDRLSVFGSLAGGSSLALGGAAVRDELAFWSSEAGPGRIRVDLARRRFGYDTWAGGGLVSGVERLRVSAFHINVSGDARTNEVYLDGCDVLASSGPGDDVVSVSSESSCRSRLAGGPGDDRLVGGRSRDVILGGRGSDRAVGGAGYDSCRAEIVRGCERVT